jgi:hypothetical protein
MASRPAPQARQRLGAEEARQHCFVRRFRVRGAILDGPRIGSDARGHSCSAQGCPGGRSFQDRRRHGGEGLRIRKMVMATWRRAGSFVFRATLVTMARSTNRSRASPNVAQTAKDTSPPIGESCRLPQLRRRRAVPPQAINCSQHTKRYEAPSGAGRAGLRIFLPLAH